MSNILAVSPNGRLRLRKINKTTAVVELNSGDRWVYCVWRATDLSTAEELFNSQVKFHQD